MKKIMRRTLSVFTAMTLCFSLMVTVPVTAETVGAFDIEGGVINTDYTYENGILTINTDTPIRIKNTDPDVSTTDRIVVADGVSAKITLAGVNIDVSREGPVSAFEICFDSTGNVVITLENDNILKSGSNYAGLTKSGPNGSLEIKGTGSLEAVGGSGGAGIGGSKEAEGANITITSGKIIATATSSGAGIGGGSSGNGYNIKINGGTVIATSGTNYANGGGAGIGGGTYGSGSYITINNGNVKTMAYGGAGIGSGKEASDEGSSHITINNGIVEAEGATGIGGGDCGSASNITINGGTVTAIGNTAAGIGSGMEKEASDITITGGTVTAISESTSSAGIGGSHCGARINSSRGVNITISGGVVNATGGTGIGGGSDSDGVNIKISGGTVTASGKRGAGIGGGLSDALQLGGNARSIFISGASSVKAISEEGNNIGGGKGAAALTPKNDNSENVYLLELDVDGTSDVTINQIAYPKNHGTDNKLYVYLPAKTEADPNVVKIGNDISKYYYDLVNSEWVKIEETITEVATPVFNPENETEFIDSQTVTITCDTEGATIYYTTDGTTPSTSGNVYNGELIITETTTIKAIAVKDGIESEIATAEYIKKTSDDDEPDLPSPPSPPSSSDDDDEDDDDDDNDDDDDDNDDNDDDGDISAGENIFIKEIIL